MSVEAAPVASELALASDNVAVPPESEIVTLLREQNALLRELLAATRPGSALLDLKGAKFKRNCAIGAGRKPVRIGTWRPDSR